VRPEGGGLLCCEILVRRFGTAKRTDMSQSHWRIRLSPVFRDYCKITVDELKLLRSNSHVALTDNIPFFLEVEMSISVHPIGNS